MDFSVGEMYMFKDIPFYSSFAKSLFLTNEY